MTSSAVEVAGDWTHRYVAANGARFHVALSTPSTAEIGGATGAGGSAATPLVVLLHGFPEFWWAWRHQLPALARAGFAAAAVDLRGYGGSDKTPRGYDPLTLAADVAGVIRALGARDAVVVGQGWGGYVGWSLAGGHPEQVRALCAVAAPHPLAVLRAPYRHVSRATLAHVAAMQVPWLPERRIMRGRYVDQHLSRWSGSGSAFPSAAESARYRSALALWPSPHCALEYHRWVFRSRLRADGRAFARVMRTPVYRPVLHMGGAEDPAVGAVAVAESGRHVRAAFATETLPGVGHFPQEEDPQRFTSLLLAWLAALP
ncbi:MAG TPA: alpha/beta hydrolase [Nocardioidaceae bacterium]|nr:alpha/beta hydrolase [Nocardioidaceae bacterium]